LLWAALVFIGRRLELIEASNDQSLLVGSVLVVMALITFLIGLLADRVGGLRRVQDEVLYRVRAMQTSDEEWRREVLARLAELEREVERDRSV
jgi:hypothetical protein